MALQNQPDFIPQPFAANGDKNEISTTSTTNGLASWAEGFNTINSMPLAAGGVAPSRLDFNGMFNVLSQFAMYAQQGGVFAWGEGQDYGANAIVKSSNGEFYKSLQASGPNNGGAQSPLTATSYWQKLTPAATTTVTGILKLATEALALAGVDDTTAMTPALVKAVIDACRASDGDIETGTSTTKFPSVAQLVEVFNTFDGADVDLSNVSDTGKAAAVSWAMPDYDNQTSLDATMVKDKEYTAVKNGYFILFGQIDRAYGAVVLSVNGISFPFPNSGYDAPFFVSFAVASGDVLVWEGGDINVCPVIFVPLKGEIADA